MSDEPQPMADWEVEELRAMVDVSSKRRMALDSWRILATIDSLRDSLAEAEARVTYWKAVCTTPITELVARADAAESRLAATERVVEAAREVELAWAGWIFASHTEPALLKAVDDAVFHLSAALSDNRPEPEADKCPK